MKKKKKLRKSRGLHKAENRPAETNTEELTDYIEECAGILEEAQRSILKDDSAESAETEPETENTAADTEESGLSFGTVLDEEASEEPAGESAPEEETRIVLDEEMSEAAAEAAEEETVPSDVPADAETTEEPELSFGTILDEEASEEPAEEAAPAEETGLILDEEVSEAETEKPFSFGSGSVEDVSFAETVTRNDSEEVPVSRFTAEYAEFLEKLDEQNKEEETGVRFAGTGTEENEEEPELSFGTILDEEAAEESAEEAATEEAGIVLDEEAAEAVVEAADEESIPEETPAEAEVTEEPELSFGTILDEEAAEEPAEEAAAEEAGIVLDEEAAEAEAEAADEEAVSEETPAEAEVTEEPELTFGTILDEEAAEEPAEEAAAEETGIVLDEEVSEAAEAEVTEEPELNFGNISDAAEETVSETKAVEDSYKPSSAEEREVRMAAADQIEERPKLRIIETMRPVKPFDEKEAELRMEQKNVVRGHWIHKTIEDASYMRGYKILSECTCSECGYEARAERPVCPGCGAVMKND